MAGRRSRHRLTGVGSLALKGLSEPVDTVEVFWEPLGRLPTNQVPLPGRLGAHPSVGVVGREVDWGHHQARCRW
jgi:hypothetical protein